MTTVGLHDLRIECIVGLYPEERHRPQPVFLDVEIDLDTTAAAHSQRISDTVDYNRLWEVLSALAERRRFLLLEAFAEEAAAAVLRECVSATRVRLEIRKPGAVAAARDAFVRLERRQI